MLDVRFPWTEAVKDWDCDNMTHMKTGAKSESLFADDLVVVFSLLFTEGIVTVRQMLYTALFLWSTPQGHCDRRTMPLNRAHLLQEISIWA